MSNPEKRSFGANPPPGSPFEGMEGKTLAEIEARAATPDTPTTVEGTMGDFKAIVDRFAKFDAAVDDFYKREGVPTRGEMLAILRSLADSARAEERSAFRERALEWRAVEDPCDSCGGSGVKTYGSTSTWRGGVGGQMVTTDVCDACWGRGDKVRTGANLREIESRVAAARAEGFEAGKVEGIESSKDWYAAAYQRGIEAEREACAKLVEDEARRVWSTGRTSEGNAVQHAAALIRARGTGGGR